LQFDTYEHFWVPEFKTSFYGAYLHVDYNADATSFICSATRGTVNAAFNSALVGPRRNIVRNFGNAVLDQDIAQYIAQDSGDAPKKRAMI
jgi:hypothetical protein